MLNAQQLVKTGLNAITDNAPVILTVFGAVGVVGTAVLTGKATFEAADRIRDARLEKASAFVCDGGTIDDSTYAGIQLTKTETVKEVWPLYIPAVITGTSSIAAIIMSHRISSRRAAMLAAAYALNQDKLEEYQDKIKEKFGVKKEKDARDELAQEKVNQLTDSGYAFANPLSGKVWIMEAYTGRPFMSSVENVNRAVNDINHQINDVGSVRLSDFYDEIAQITDGKQRNTLLPHVSTSDHFGFTDSNRLELDWTTTTSPDGSLAVHVFDYVNHPVMNPEREAGFR